MESGAIRRVPPLETPVPSGTVAFLFSDIEGSTVRWERYPEAMREAVREHDALVRAVVARTRGYVFKTIGDAFCVAFARPQDAVAAALDVQRALATADFSTVDGIRIRIGIHLGACDERDGDYFGPPVNRVARLMSTAHGGQVVISRVVADVVRFGLPPGAGLRDLGEHRLKDLAEPEHVFQLTAPELAAEFPALRSLSVLRNNLPLQLGPLLGRDDAVSGVVAALDETRLVTLLGPGGIGKTRIALHVGAEVSGAWPDGVWFVDLGSLTTGGFVAETLASTLDVPPAAGKSASEFVMHYLRERTLLLVLDNCEHVIAEATALVEKIVRTTPGVAVLATSREALNIAGERIVRVPSLDVPPAGAVLRAAGALSYGAVALFVARAQASDARFVLTDDTAPIVAEIVRRLDGIALAIELAAARVRVLGIPNLARRLDERFRVLSGGSRTALPRQRTMRALIDWSWDLLSEVERAVLRRAAIFAGGWTVEAAERICEGEHVDSLDVLDAMTSLVEKSLVAMQSAGMPRGRLLESMRAYALEKLEESGEREAAALRHAEWFVEFCNAMHESYEANDAWFETMEAELDNARAALRWSLDGGRADLAAKIVVRAMCGYWWYRAPHEGTDWAEQTLARLDAEAEPVLAAALYGVLGSYCRGERSVAAYERAVAILGPLVDAGVDVAPYTRLTYCLGGLSASLLAQGRTGEARAAIERVCELYARDGLTHTRGYASTLVNSATAWAIDGAMTRAREVFDEARALFSSLAEPPGLASVALARAGAEFSAGDVSAACSYATEAYATYVELGLHVGAVEALASMAACAYVLGDAAAARNHARAGVERAAAAQIDLPSATLLAVALLACGDGDDASAMRLLGFAEAERRREGRYFDGVASSLHERLLAAARTSLDESALRALLAEGAGLAPAAVLTAVRRVLDETGVRPRTRASSLGP